MNGVPVEGMLALPDGTQVYSIAGLLFDHAARVDQALHRLIQQTDFLPISFSASAPHPPPVLQHHAPFFPHVHSPSRTGMCNMYERRKTRIYKILYVFFRSDLAMLFLLINLIIFGN